jgi:hypothetical protein
MFFDFKIPNVQSQDDIVTIVALLVLFAILVLNIFIFKWIFNAVFGHMFEGTFKPIGFFHVLGLFFVIQSIAAVCSYSSCITRNTFKPSF